MDKVENIELDQVTDADILAYERKQQAERVALLTAVGNEPMFCKYYFSEYCTAEFGWFHIEALLNIADDNSFNVWEWAREHAKSVFSNVFVPALKLARGELSGFILASENNLKAKTLLKDFEKELKTNSRFVDDFGPFKIEGSWNKGHYTVNGNIGFWAFGLGQNPAGVRSAENRPNVGVVDDVDNKKKAKNQTRVKEDLDWVLGEFLGCLSLKGKTFIYANNRLAKKGLTAHIVGDIEESDPKREGIKHIKVFATENPITHEALLIDEGGIPAWVERYSIEDIQQRINEMGYRNSMRQLYHRHIEDGNIFTDKHLPWADVFPLHEYDNLITYCDPSYKDTKKNDYKAIVLIGQRGNYSDIIWCWVRQTTKSNMVKAHYDIHEDLGFWNSPDKKKKRSPPFWAKIKKGKELLCNHWMEANFIQDLLLDEYTREGNIRGYQLHIRPDTRKKPDKYGRIEELETLGARGYLRFNRLLKKTPDMESLRDQFLAFPNGNDDGPDAVEGAIHYLAQQSRVGAFEHRYGKGEKQRGF